MRRAVYRTPTPRSDNAPPGSPDNALRSISGLRSLGIKLDKLLHRDTISPIVGRQPKELVNWTLGTEYNT